MIKTISKKIWDSGALFALVTFLVVYAVVPRVMGPIRAKSYSLPETDIVAPIVANGEGLPLEFHLGETKGRAVLLDFWATWCGPCKLQSPAVDKVHQKYKDRGLQVYGVDASDDADEIREHVAKHSLTTPMIVDDKNALSHAFRVSSIPTLVLIDKAGKVRAVHTGLTAQSVIESEVESVLSEP